MGTAQCALAHLIAAPVQLLWKRPAWSTRRGTETLGPDRERFRCSTKEAPSLTPIPKRRLAPPFYRPRPYGQSRVPSGTLGHSAGPSGSGSGAIRSPFVGWAGSEQVSAALRTGTHLREDANEKWAGVLGEKLRGLSRGLLPVAERGGSFKPVLGGNPIRPPDPQRGLQTASGPL